MKPPEQVLRPPVPARNAAGPRLCRSCGAEIEKGRRRYCDLDCRRRLLDKLTVTACLLRAMNTRCASFSFTGTTLVLNVVVWGHDRVFTYFWQRTPGLDPATDLLSMNEHLGQAWWREHDKRRCRVHAAQVVLERAEFQSKNLAGVLPIRKKSPRVGSRLLTVLCLERDALTGPDPLSAVKTAFRKQALKHHPDADGDAATFRRVYDAYTELLEWVKNPVHTRRSGIPGKWSFNGEKWRTPLASHDGR